MTLALVMAAGSGQRLGLEQHKPYLSLLGHPIITYSVRAFEDCPAVDDVIVVADKNLLNQCRTTLDEYGFSKVSQVIPGGQRRQDSVFNGLAAASDASDAILVHDSARPLVTGGLAQKALDGLPGWDGVVVARPAVDTVKWTEGQRVQRTLDRERVWLAQTPQVFRAAALREAHQAAKRDHFLGTDDASLMEWRGYKVKVVLGDETNIKITTPVDLKLAENLLRQRAEPHR